MQFHYLNRHKSCPQYIGDRPIGFVLFSEKKGETVHDFLRIPLLLFVVSGKLKIISNTKQETVIADNQMVATICEDGYILEAMADTVCLRLYVMGDGLNFCHRIVSFPKDMESDGTGKVLTMVPGENHRATNGGVYHRRRAVLRHTRTETTRVGGGAAGLLQDG